MFTRNIFLIYMIFFLAACSDVNFSSVGDGKVVDQDTPDCTDCDTDPPDCADCDNDDRTPELVNQSLTVPAATNKVDILFVLDNSGSMAPQLEELATRFPNFISSLSTLDWQICATTTDINKEDGRLLPFPNSSKWINKTTANHETEFFNLLNGLPGGAGDERGILAINRALDRNEGCFRSGAALGTVVISDEDERSTGGGDASSTQNRVLDPRDFASSVFDTLTAKAWTKVYSAHSIVIKPGDNTCLAAQQAEAPAWFGTHYAELTKLTSGILGDICASNYGSQLGAMGTNIKNSIDSVPLQCDPVTSTGVAISSASGVIQSIVPATGSVATLIGNKINFSPALPQGTTLTMKYYCLR